MCFTVYKVQTTKDARPDETSTLAYGCRIHTTRDQRMVRENARNVLPWELEPTVRADVLGRRVPMVLAHHAALHQREVATAGLARAVGRRLGLVLGLVLGLGLGLG